MDAGSSPIPTQGHGNTLRVREFLGSCSIFALIFDIPIVTILVYAMRKSWVTGKDGNVNVTGSMNGERKSIATGSRIK